MDTETREPARRAALKKGAAALAALALIPIAIVTRPATAGMGAKADFHYQDFPHDGKHCSDCTAFIPDGGGNGPGTCRVVAGPISRDGWCMAFSPK